MNESRRPVLVVSAVFLLLAASVAALMSIYWVVVLRPRTLNAAPMRGDRLFRSRCRLPLMNDVTSGFSSSTWLWKATRRQTRS